MTWTAATFTATIISLTKRFNMPLDLYAIHIYSHTGRWLSLTFHLDLQKVKLCYHVLRAVHPPNVTKIGVKLCIYEYAANKWTEKCPNTHVDHMFLDKDNNKHSNSQTTWPLKLHVYGIPDCQHWRTLVATCQA